MKKFLGVYIGMADAREKSGWNKLEPAELEKRQGAGIKAWKDWMAKHQAAVVETGGPLGKTKRIGPQGISDMRNNLVGYVVVQAESHQAAAEMFQKHPHFTLFPGDSVEVMECLPTARAKITQHHAGGGGGVVDDAPAQRSPSPCCPSGRPAQYRAAYHRRTATTKACFGYDARS